MRYAIRNIGRLKTRSFLLFSIVLVLLFLSMFGIMISALCTDSRERSYGPLDGSVYVTDSSLSPVLSYQAALVIAENSDVITGVSAIKNYDVFLPGIEYIGKGLFKRERFQGEPFPVGSLLDYGEGFRLCGVTSMEILEEVYSGNLSMVEGTIITEQNNERHDNKIVISEALAKKNGLSIGDAVPVHIMSLFWDEQESLGEYHLESFPDSDCYFYIVGGIYRNEQDNLGSVDKPYLVNDNKIYVPLSSIEDITKNQAVQNSYIITFLFRLIDNPLLIPDFLYFHLSDADTAEILEEKLNEIGFEKDISLIKYMSDAASSPAARLSEIISILLAGTATVGLIIFLLIIFFNMKARHRELAVLTALGKRRSTVAGSFFIEVGLLTCFAWFLGIVIFSISVWICAAPITQYLSSAEISSKITNETADYIIFGDILNDRIFTVMTDFPYLLKEYIMPACFITLSVIAAVMPFIYLFIYFYVKKINALSAVGGKE